MHGVGPGTILGGRYAVHRRLSHRSALEHWSAHDNTLERDVAITVFSTEHSNAAAVLDAARRAAGVEDSRLVRILDVGTHEGLSYVVEEALSGAESLATLLIQGPLPAEEARRVAGEVAAGLETARQRGLHHLRLSPHAVCRTTDGSVKVSGVAIAAAIDGVEEPDSSAASRTDAAGVVAIAYAALTGRWPLPEPVGGIEQAPRVVGGVAAPSEIAAGVPGDLDALCRMTLNEGSGPQTPGELAAQIAPWSRDPVPQAATTEPTVRLTVPATATSERRNQGSDAQTIALEGAGIAAPTERTAGGGAGPDAGPGTSTGESAGVATGAAAAKAVGTALAGAGAAAGAVTGKVGTFARAAADKAAAARAARPASERADERLRLPDVLAVSDEDLAEPPLPMLPASTAQDPTRDQSKLVVAIVAVFVLLSLLAGYCGMRQIGGGSDTADQPQRTVPATAPAATRPPTPAPTTSAPPTAKTEPVAILSATGFDPLGDNKERNSEAARVYDGKTSTQWTSEGYTSASFGGLKAGVGVLLDLGQPTKLRKIALALGSGATDVTVYAATRASVTQGATVLGSKAGATGTVELTAPATAPSTELVIVWFTSAAQIDASYRAVLSEVALSR